MEILLAGVLLLAVVIVTIFAVKKASDDAFKRKLEQEKQQQHNAIEEFRRRSTIELGKNPSVVERVCAKARETDSYPAYWGPGPHYAMTDDAIYFGDPINAKWVRGDIKDAAIRTISWHSDNSGRGEEYKIELTFNDLSNPTGELWFLYKREANSFFARLGLIFKLK